MKNITYTTDQIARYFASNRVTWPQFYESERTIIESLRLGPNHEILDIGCGCGGLGLALRDQFGVKYYTGAEINASAASVGRTMNRDARILCGDILALKDDELRGKSFDVVFSLSCVDWNIRFSDMLAVAWNHVKPGGHLVATFRLTPEEGCSDFEKSFQYINYEGISEGERAAYVVLNARNLVLQLRSFDPMCIDAYGYWGAPSATAVTPYERLCFTAISVKKRGPNDTGPFDCKLDLPVELLESIGMKTTCPPQ